MTTTLTPLPGRADLPVDGHAAETQVLHLPVSEAEAWAGAAPTARRLRRIAAALAGRVVIPAEQDWHTRAVVRVLEDHKVSVPLLWGEQLVLTDFQRGDELEVVQHGPAGQPVDRGWWDTDTEIRFPGVRGLRFVPAAAVEVLAVIDETPPFVPSGTVYLLHFERPFGHARHYLGWTDGPLERRLALHGGPGGANLMRHVAAAGIGWRLARVWDGDRHRERQLKNQGGRARLCPVCGPWRRRPARSSGR
jgi:hypothetical protein